MKNIFLLTVLLLNGFLFAQSEIKITPKKCIPKKGYHLKLKSVFDDSRCPQGVTCIWAGEVSVMIEIYKDKKLVEEKTITFNSKNKQENNMFFEKYYSKKTQSILVEPYPKDGVTIQPKKQFIKIIFVD